MDFKFRALELLEIYILKADQPQNLIYTLPKLILEVKSASSDKHKQAYCKRIMSLISKFLEKSLVFSPAHMPSVEESIKIVLAILAKYLLYEDSKCPNWWKITQKICNSYIKSEKP